MEIEEIKYNEYWEKQCKELSEKMSVKPKYYIQEYNSKWTEVYDVEEFNKYEDTKRVAYPDYRLASNFLKLIQMVQWSFEGLKLDTVSQAWGDTRNIQEDLISRLDFVLRTKRCGLIVPYKFDEYYNEELHVQGFLENIKKVIWDY